VYRMTRGEVNYLSRLVCAAEMSVSQIVCYFIMIGRPTVIYEAHFGLRRSWLSQMFCPALEVKMEIVERRGKSRQG